MRIDTLNISKIRLRILSTEGKLKGILMIKKYEYIEFS
jgi:hypothetical protein